MRSEIDSADSINFSSWLYNFTQSLKDKGENQVPCGDCVGCCTSSLFIHIETTDKDSIKVIPRGLMFPAPGLPKGFYVLGYDENGHCPMFREGQCTIYESRPETCRQYDCRVYPATGIFPENKESEIFKKSMCWKFDISSTNDLELIEAVKNASDFLLKYQKLFPKLFFPQDTSQQAILAIRIHDEFIGIDKERIRNRAKEIAKSIVLKYSN